MSGVFLAEQIRQQQLAAALESRIKDSGQGASSMDYMQAALLMSKLSDPSGSSAAAQTDTSKLLAIAAAAAAKAAQDTGLAASVTPKAGSSKRSKKNTVASMLAASKGANESNRDAYNLLAHSLTPEELATAERATANPELTIEPIFKSKADK